MGIEKVYLKELARELGFVDIRSAKRYCQLNGIAILKDIGSRFAYVMRSDYETARMRAFIRILKKRHGKDWLKAYQAHVDMNIELLSALQDAGRKDQSSSFRNNLPVHTGSNEQRFLEDINSLLHQH